MLRIIRRLTSHPLNQANRSGALARFARWQIGTRLLKMPHLVPFVDDTVLVVERGMTGATGNYYCGLLEQSDMAFVLHFLRPNDLFVDVGANIGSYTVLASGVAKAKTVSIEPIPNTFRNLKRNVIVNQIDDRVECHNIGLGASDETLRFVSSRDTTNRVATEHDQESDLIDVPVRRLSAVLADARPVLIKIDVEGWEAEVLKGMPEQLAQSSLAAIIMETNANSDRYGDGREDEVSAIMTAAGFKPCIYDPFARVLVEGGSDENTIFVRNFDRVRERTKSAGCFQLINGTI
jgi:FkbM family methyltransferase